MQMFTVITCMYTPAVEQVNYSLVSSDTSPLLLHQLI